MNTVGYGDITPKNSTEKLFSTIFVFFACGIFAYCISSIGKFVKGIRADSEHYWKAIGIMNGYMRRKKISFDLKTRICKYIEYLLRECKENEAQNENEIIDKLSQSLKQNLIYESNKEILEKFPFISTGFSLECIKKIVTIIKEEKFSPNDVIFSKGDLNKAKIYLIHEGQVQIVPESIEHLEEKSLSPRKTQTVLTVLQTGEVFGEIAFFSGMARSATAISTDYTSVFSIDRNEVLSILSNFPRDWEKFCQLRDEIIVYQNIDKLNLKCYSCREKSHISLNCPLLHQIPMIPIVLARYNFSQPQQRLEKRRKNRKILNSLQNQKIYLKKRRKFEAAVLTQLGLNFGSSIIGDQSELSEFESPRTARSGGNIEDISLNSEFCSLIPLNDEGQIHPVPSLVLTSKSSDRNSNQVFGPLNSKDEPAPVEEQIKQGKEPIFKKKPPERKISLLPSIKESSEIKAEIIVPTVEAKPKKEQIT